MVALRKNNINLPEEVESARSIELNIGKQTLLNKYLYLCTLIKKDHISHCYNKLFRKRQLIDYLGGQFEFSFSCLINQIDQD